MFKNFQWVRFAAQNWQTFILKYMTENNLQAKMLDIINIDMIDNKYNLHILYKYNFQILSRCIKIENSIHSFDVVTISKN